MDKSKAITLIMCVFLIMLTIGCSKQVKEIDKAVLVEQNKDIMTNKINNVNDSTLAVIIDAQTYNAAAIEVDQFIKDLKKDTNFNVDLKVVPPDTEKETIKNYLKGLYFDSNLQITIFIGEIPTAEYFPGTVSQEKIPTDSYYYDVYDRCPFNEQNQAFESRNNFCNPIILPFIISRITAPFKGSEGTQLIKGYLNNNHAFRNGIVSFDQKALIYPQTINDIAGSENKADTMENMLGNFMRFFAIDSLPIYEKEELIVADWESTESNPAPNEKFLEELSKNHQYIFIDAHGYPEGHLYNVNKDTIKNPNAFYADFYSCNVGKYTHENYVAGHYLTRGKTMFVKASSDFLFKPIGLVESQKLFLLKQGLPILDTIKVQEPSFIVQFFGDPTLRMPQGIKQKNSKAKINLDRNEIDFGEVNVCNNILNYRDCEDSSGISKVTFTILNKGQDDLGFFLESIPDFSFELIENSRPQNAYNKPYQITFDNVAYNIKPNQKNSFTVNMLGIVKGSYSGKILIYNNDPKIPLIKIPYRVKVIG